MPVGIHRSPAKTVHGDRRKNSHKNRGQSPAKLRGVDLHNRVRKRIAYMKDEKSKTISNPDEANDTNSESTTISERKLAANRANALKSTGPRTQRGKSYSRLNSFRHGLLARRVMFDGEGKLLDPELLALHEALCEQYGTDDIRVQLLLDTLIIDYWRMKQALEYEVASRSISGYMANSWMAQVQRYVTANRNSFMKNLDLLSKAKQPEEENAEAVEAA